MDVEQCVANRLGLAVQGRDFSPTHYRSASSANTCAVNRVMQLQDMFVEDMRVSIRRVILFTNVRSL